MLFLQEHAQEHGGEHPLPGSIFTWLYSIMKDEPALKSFNFTEENKHYGQIWFETLCFSIVLVIFLSVVAIVVSRKVRKVPRGGQNFFEMLIEMLTKVMCGLAGPEVKPFMPYLFTLFIYIFCMNAMGLIPAFRSPTMTISTTAALGIVTFFVIHGAGLKHNGPLGYFLHYTGKSPIKKPAMVVVYFMVIAPLMVGIHVIGEIIKPVTLSARLFANIFADDTGVEQIMFLGHGFPSQIPFMLFGILVSMIQAIVFTALTAFYLKFMLAHEEEEEH